MKEGKYVSTSISYVKPLLHNEASLRLLSNFHTSNFSSRQLQQSRIIKPESRHIRERIERAVGKQNSFCFLITSELCYRERASVTKRPSERSCSRQGQSIHNKPKPHFLHLVPRSCLVNRCHIIESRLRFEISELNFVECSLETCVWCRQLYKADPSTLYIQDCHHILTLTLKGYPSKKKNPLRIS